MDLNVQTKENLAIILNAIGKRLDVANQILLDPKHYDLEKYDDLKDMYDMLQKKGKLTPMETHAFIDELKTARKL